VVASLIFSAIVIVGIIILSQKYGWKGFRVKPKDVVVWAIYGFLIPIWIQFDYVFANINALATIVSAILFGIAFVILFGIFKRKSIPMLPIVTTATIVVYLILVYAYTPPSPSDWSRWATFGRFTPPDVFGNAFYLAPPWIAGLAIARTKPKLVILLPAFVFSYNLSLPLVLSAAKILVNVSVYLIMAYIVVALIVYLTVRGSRT